MFLLLFVQYINYTYQIYSNNLYLLSLLPTLITIYGKLIYN